MGFENAHARDWLTRLDASQPTGGEDYLLAFGGGEGIRLPNGPLRVTHQDSTSARYAMYHPNADFRGVFNFLFGSWFMDFDQPQNVLSGALAVNGKALVVMPHGRPGIPLHLAALGAPVGDLLRTIVDGSANYSFAYDTEQEPDAVWANRQVSIQGDPALHFEFVKPVTGVAAQTLSNGTREISWTAPAGESSLLGYRVYRSASADGPFAPINSGFHQQTTITDAHSTPGQHFYMVRAVKLETTPSGTYQNASTGVIVGTTAAEVTGKSFAFATTHAIAFQFDRDVQGELSNTDLVLDNVLTEERIDPSHIVLSNYDAGTNTATFTFTGFDQTHVQSWILDRGNYRAVISAEDVAINGEPMVADVVLDFFVTPGDVDHDTLVNLDDFNVMSNNFGQSGRDYTQGDFSYDGTVNLDDFNILSANFGTTLAPPPSGPGEVTVSVVSDGEIRLNWIDSVTGESGWRVQRSEDGINFTWYDNILGSASSYEAAGLQDGKRYWFRVRAYSDSQTNPDGPDTAYTPKKAGTTTLPAPVAFSVQPSGSAGSLLSWSHSAQNAVDAVIQRSTNGVTWSTIDEQSESILSYTDGGLSSGQRYYYRVFLENDLIESAPSYVEYLDVA